jgi:hypothetical protein
MESFTNENETWQQCVVCNSDPVPALVRALSFSLFPHVVWRVLLSRLYWVTGTFER